MKRAQRVLKKAKWSVWAELLRLPNLFTVPGDILLGWCLGGMRGGIPFLPIVASLCLYAAGLLWNDCFDASIDAKERPQRPIPSGRVSRYSVFFVACLLAVLGIFASWTGYPIAVVLTGTILFYNLLAKHLPWIGVITMGVCRGLNVYLGVAASWPLHQAPLPTHFIWAFLFFTSYIVLVSVIAKNEAKPGVKVGSIRMLAPLMTLSLLPLFAWYDRGIWWLPLLVAGAMVLFLLRRHKVPALVAGLIRFLIPLQCVWCLSMYDTYLIQFLSVFLILELGALIAARRFSGS